MAGLVPAIHDLPHGAKNVDARDKPGHDVVWSQGSIAPPHLNSGVPGTKASKAAQNWER
jgi:hypothetical protein